MKFGSIYYIMSFSARTTNVCICIYLQHQGGRMEAAGIYTQSGGCCVKILLSFPSKPKTRSPPLLSLYYRQESLCIFGGLLLSKNEAQARRRRCRSFQGIRGQPCVKDTVVVILDLYIRFRYYLLLPDNFSVKPTCPTQRSQVFLFFNEISLTYSYNSKGALKEFWRKM